MDLHIVGAEPTAEERAAVDALLGLPESGWAGGRRDSAQDGRMSRAGLEEVRDRRDLLLPAFHAVQDRVGWVSRGALNYICKRLIVPPAEAWGVLTFYHLFKTEPTPRVIAHVCDDIACRLNGADEICTSLDGQIAWQRSPCLGQCDRAAAALIIRAGDAPSTQTVVGVSSAREVVDAVRHASSRSLNRPEHVVGTKLLRRVGNVDPASIDSYRAHGGYQALKRALEMGPSAVIAEVATSNLLGRGGAAFPTGRKWEAVAREQARPHFLVCNADESEPGTFKDRVLLEEDPFAIVEAMTIAAFATGCTHGFIYLRGEYPLAHERVHDAIDAARQAQLLGENILQSPFRFDLEIRRGAGAYICGEETALFNSLEGKRGEPRSKPPFPAQVGLFGKPTVVNNVETLINVIDIVLEGGAEWARVGTKESTGTRLFCLSGNVAKPGLYELAFGATLGELLAIAGGVPDNRPLQAVLLGGAAGTFVGPDALSLRLTFEDVRVAGATLGSGVVMVFDDRADLGDTLLRIARFMEDESCGQCVPCRVGTVRQVEILERLQRSFRTGADLVVPARTDADIALLGELGQCMRDASICGLGQTASSAVETAIARLHLFRHVEGAP
jgi:NADH-quinone oxidoreductase subunit F